MKLGITLGGLPFDYTCKFTWRRDNVGGLGEHVAVRRVANCHIRLLYFTYLSHVAVS